MWIYISLTIFVDNDEYSVILSLKSSKYQTFKDPDYKCSIDLEHFNCIEINNVPLNLINHGNYAFSLKKVYCFLRFVLN